MRSKISSFNRLLCACGFLLFFLAFDANAQLSIYGGVNAFSSDGTQGTNGTAATTSTGTELDLSFSSSSTYSTADIDINAGYAALHGDGTATGASKFLGYSPYLYDSLATFGGIPGTGSDAGTATAVCELAFTSSTLTNGAPVQVQVIFGCSGSAKTNYTGICYVEAGATVTFSAGGQSTNFSFFSTDSTGSGGSQVFSPVINTQVGSSIIIESSLLFSGIANFNENQLAAVQDEVNTGSVRLNVDADTTVSVLTPGVSYTTGITNNGINGEPGTPFKYPTNATITVIASPPEGGTVTGGGTFNVGNPDTISATSNPGYIFKNWTDSGFEVTNSPSYTFTVIGNTTFVANFVPITVSGKADCICGNTPIVGASVEMDDGDSDIYSATTDPTGAYSISGVVPGEYTVTISAHNYETLTTNLTVPDDTTNVTADFGLTNATVVILPTFDESLVSDPNETTITNAINAAIPFYSQYLADPMCVTILFKATTDATFLGQTDPAWNSLSYSQYLDDLKANPNKSANDITALANLPTGVSPGINNNSQIMYLTAANCAAIGETGDAAVGISVNGDGYYGTITLNTSTSTLTGLQSTVEHEIDEVLGIGGHGSTLNAVSTQTSPFDAYMGTMDLFRFSGVNLRNFTDSANVNPAPYFSIDGGQTRLVFFNQDAGGDFGDWGNGAVPVQEQGNNPPQVQDAFGSGNATLGANELIALDVVGYTLAANAPTLRNLKLTDNNFQFCWDSLPGLTYQVQYNTDLLQGSWVDLGDPITATGLVTCTSDSGASVDQRFYRVIVLSPPPGQLVLTPRRLTVDKPSTAITNSPVTRYFRSAHP